jgi:hypothetical protein
VLLFLAVALADAGRAAATEPRVSVEAVLKGFFLSPDGKVQIASLRLATRPHASQGPSLHPLWASYYLTAEVRSPTPVARVRLVACDDGAVLYDRRIDPPRREFGLPVTEGAFIGAHSRHGLRFRIHLQFAGAGEAFVPMAVDDARLLPRLRPRIDWLDLIRIAEVKRVLRERGETILPGMEADRVPFALAGGDGQCVLIDYPQPLPGFWEYNGPRPAQVHMQIARWGRLPKAPAAVTDFRGRPLVLLSYRPHWCALPPTGATGRSALEASQRVDTILHETTHAVWHGRTGSVARVLEPELLLVPYAEERALEATERLVVASAVEAEDTALPGLLRDYFALRDARAALGRVPAATVAGAESAETSEGFACYVPWRAGQLLNPSLQAGPLAHIDPFFRGMQDDDPLDWLPEAADQACPETGWDAEAWHVLLPTARGAMEARLLERVAAPVLAQTWAEGGSVPKALAQAVGWATLRTTERAELRKQAEARWGVDALTGLIEAQTGEVRNALRRAEKASGAGSILRARIELFGRPNGAQPRLVASQYVDGFAAAFDHVLVRVQQPCRVRQGLSSSCGLTQLAVALPPGADAVLVSQGPEGVRVRGKGVRLDARDATIEVVHGMLLVRPRGTRTNGMARSIAAPRGNRIRGTRWMVLPVAALLGSGARQAQLPHQEVCATIAGVFEDARTAQQEYLELDLLDEDNWPEGDWQLVEDETYTVSATMSDEEYSRVGYVAIYDPEDQLVDEAAADPPTTTLGAEGDFVATATMAFDWSLEPTHNPDCTWSLKLVIKPRPEPPIPVRTIKVQVLEGGTGGPPQQGASVSIWPQGHPENTETHEVDNQGWAEFTDVAQGQWMIRAWSPEHCHLQKGPELVRKRGSLKEAFRVYLHFGIRGKLFITGQAGPGDIEMTLLQGDTVIDTGTVAQQQNEDGSCYYYFSCPQPAGGYTTRAYYPGNQATDEDPVTVPDECTAAHSDVDGGGLTVLLPGAHSLVTGPVLTLDTGGGEG